MVEENLKDKIKKLKELKKEAELRASKVAGEMEKDAARERKIITSIEELVLSLPPIHGTVKDNKAFFTEERTYLKLEWFLYYDRNIHVLYTETPTERAKGSAYESKREEKSISDFNLEMKELIYKQLPEFADVLIQKATKFRQ